VASCEAGEFLRYHGVFRQGKRGKASPARSITIHPDGTSPGTTVDAVLCLFLVSWESTNRLLAR
jgi:hypothetical protein